MIRQVNSYDLRPGMRLHRKQDSGQYSYTVEEVISKKDRIVTIRVSCYPELCPDPYDCCDVYDEEIQFQKGHSIAIDEPPSIDTLAKDYALAWSEAFKFAQRVAAEPRKKTRGQFGYMPPLKYAGENKGRNY